jgi:hypothetical protein
LTHRFIFHGLGKVFGFHPTQASKRKGTQTSVIPSADRQMWSLPMPNHRSEVSRGVWFGARVGVEGDRLDLRATNRTPGRSPLRPPNDQLGGIFNGD